MGDRDEAFGIKDLLPWLTAGGIVAAAVAGVVAIRGTTDLLASEIRGMSEVFRVEISHLSTAVTDLKGAVRAQEESVARIQAAVAAIPRTEQQLRDVEGRLRAVERHIPGAARSQRLERGNGP